VREDGLFETLKASCAEDWQAYVTHEFVRALGAGTLARASFEHYLKQDYLFLIHFARAYALAVYKSPTLEDMRHAQSVLAALLDQEMTLHVGFCARWGIDEARLQAEPEATANMAYTRYVLETGNAGDLLDLYVALAPCVVGYAEVARWLEAQSYTRVEGNPYREWIEMYAGEEYQGIARGAVSQLDELMARLGAPSRLPRLRRTFRDATRLELGFWQMGLDRSW
jgi:thiaminase/transcriptional activator TenA